MQADRSVGNTQSNFEDTPKVSSADFEKEFRSLFGEIANLKILSGEYIVFDDISKQKKIIFFSQHSNKKEPSYLRDLVEALMKSDENNKVLLLFELYSDFDLNEVTKLINEDPSLFEKISSFSENINNLIKTIGKLKEKYGERFEVTLIDIPAVEVLKATKNLSKLAGVDSNSIVAKCFNLSEEEFESMSIKPKIEILDTCNEVSEMIKNKTEEKFKNIEKIDGKSMRDEDIKYIEQILRYSDLIFLKRNIKIVENAEKIYNGYKDDHRIVFYYGGLLHGFEILKELKEVNMSTSQKITVYIPAENISPASYVFFRFPTSKELAKADTFGEALRR